MTDLAMDTDRVLLVIVLTALIVIGVNGILYVALRRGNEANLVDLTRKSLQNVRNPWQAEDQALEELSRLVANLNSPESTNSTDERVENGSDQPASRKIDAQ
jgi:hypothetical protein